MCLLLSIKAIILLQDSGSKSQKMLNFKTALREKKQCIIFMIKADVKPQIR